MMHWAAAFRTIYERKEGRLTLGWHSAQPATQIGGTGAGWCQEFILGSIQG